MRRAVSAAIVAGLLGGGGWVAAQQKPLIPPDDPGILSGSDIGFRLEGKTPDGKVTGTWMVRLKSGVWVEAHATPTGGRVIPLAR